ncbi:MAG: hypothetical protein AVDCRST_MAG83-2772, partial [uncultured Arthrobacter sp.]
AALLPAHVHHHRRGRDPPRRALGTDGDRRRHHGLAWEPLPARGRPRGDHRQLGGRPRAVYALPPPPDALARPLPLGTVGPRRTPQRSGEGRQVTDLCRTGRCSVPARRPDRQRRSGRNRRSRAPPLYGPDRPGRVPVGRVAPWPWLPDRRLHRAAPLGERRAGNRRRDPRGARDRGCSWPAAASEVQDRRLRGDRRDGQPGFTV